jgi:formylglycine-generating enzyme required for sulfatase activity
MSYRYFFATALLVLAVSGCQTRRSAELGIEFVKIPGGVFEMGDTFGDGDVDELPVLKVKVETFYLGKTEVTVGQFRRFVDATGYKTQAEKDGFGWAWIGERLDRIRGANWQNPGFPQDEMHPVINVSWADAQAFCDWAGVRLPTEQEWEYAARNKGQKIRYAWGNDAPADAKGGNVGDISGAQLLRLKMFFNDYNDGFVFTAPVGKFAPNGLGLYDMTGNVWEWNADLYREFLGSTPPKREYSTLPMEVSRTLRGGSWDDGPVYSRCTERAGQNPTFSYPLIGFRVASSSKP